MGERPAIGLLHYIADDVEKQEIVATIHPASQVVGVDITTHVFDDPFRKTYRRTAVVRFATGDPITVDTSKYVHDGLREHAERFIDDVLGALTKGQPLG